MLCYKIAFFNLGNRNSVQFWKLFASTAWLFRKKDVSQIVALWWHKWRRIANIYNFEDSEKMLIGSKYLTFGNSMESLALNAVTAFISRNNIPLDAGINCEHASINMVSSLGWTLLLTSFTNFHQYYYMSLADIID